MQPCADGCGKLCHLQARRAALADHPVLVCSTHSMSAVGTAVMSRLAKELRELTKQPCEGIKVCAHAAPLAVPNAPRILLVQPQKQ